MQSMTPVRTTWREAGLTYHARGRVTSADGRYFYITMLSDLAGDTGLVMRLATFFLFVLARLCLEAFRALTC